MHIKAHEKKQTKKNITEQNFSEFSVKYVYSATAKSLFRAFFYVLDIKLRNRITWRHKKQKKKKHKNINQPS